MRTTADVTRQCHSTAVVPGSTPSTPLTFLPRTYLWLASNIFQTRYQPQVVSTLPGGPWKGPHPRKVPTSCPYLWHLRPIIQREMPAEGHRP